MNRRVESQLILTGGTGYVLLDQLGRISSGVAVLRPQGTPANLPDLPTFCLRVSMTVVIYVIDVIDAAWFGWCSISINRRKLIKCKFYRIIHRLYIQSVRCFLLAVWSSRGATHSRCEHPDPNFSSLHPYVGSGEIYRNWPRHSKLRDPLIESLASMATLLLKPCKRVGSASREQYYPFIAVDDSICES